MTTAVDELARIVAGLQREIANLRQPQLPHSSLHDGAVNEYETVLDEGGEVVLEQLSSIWGRQYDGTHGIVAVAGPTPPTPAGVTMESVPNGVLIHWQGEYVPSAPSGSGIAPTPVVAPMDFLHAEVHVSTDPAFSALLFATKRGEIMSARGGECFVPVGPDVDVYTRVVVRTAAGKKSLASAPVGPVAGGLIPASAVDIDLSAIGAGNTIHRGDTAPEGEHKIGDFWLQTPDNIAHRWEGDPPDWVDTRDTGIAEALDKAFQAAADAEQAGIDALAAKNAVAGKIELYRQATAPAGDIPDNYLWIDSDDNQLYVRTAGAWQPSQDAAINAAAQAAATAQATADGKVRIFPQASAPAGLTADDVGDQWIDIDDGNRIYTWSGTAWVARLLGNSAIQPQSLVASDVIVTGTVTGGLLKADAIDGKTITGATIRTAANGQRIQIDSVNGVRGIDANGVVLTQLGTDGRLTAVNAIISGEIKTAETGARFRLAQRTVTNNGATQSFGILQFFAGITGEIPASIEYVANTSDASTQGGTLIITGSQLNADGPILRLATVESPIGGYDGKATLDNSLCDQPNSIATKDYVDGTWVSYIPTWIGLGVNPAIGNGTLLGRYRRHGNFVELNIFIAFGSSTAGGNGPWQLALPFPSAAGAGEQQLGVKLWCGSGNYAGTAYISSGTSVCNPLAPTSQTLVAMNPVQNANTSNAAGTGVPQVPGNYTFMTNHNLSIFGRYECAPT